MLHRRPGVLAAHDHAVAQRDPTGPHAWPAVDLALAPAALAGAAHQPARSVEPEAPRQGPPTRREQADRDRLALDALVAATVEGELDSRRSTSLVEAGATDGRAPQRMWNVGELSMHTRFVSR